MNEKTTQVLKRAYLKPFKLQSQFARDHSFEVAEAASRGLITTHLGTKYYGCWWRLTAAGKAFLELMEDETNESDL